MIRPFTLRDLQLLKQLQREHVVLYPIEALTRPQSPLWAALTSLLPFGEGRSLTFVLQEPRREGGQRQGFIQARQPATQPIAYIQRLTPRLDADEDAHAVWNRLVNHAVTAAGERGLLRVFASAAQDSTEMAVLSTAGFSVYTREDVFRLEAGTHLQVTAPAGIRPEQSTDLWQISQLYYAIAPRLVRQAESPVEDNTSEWPSGPLEWGQGEGFILEDRDGIAGYGCLLSGQVGHWLSILVHSRAYNQVGILRDYALALLNYYPAYPVYCGVRQYQGGVRVPLEERGFKLFQSQCHLVRHTMIRVKEPARNLVPALEKRVEAPTTTVSPTERS